MLNSKIFNSYKKDIFKTGTPLSLVGFLAYVNSAADIAISSFNAANLVVATGLGALFISLMMSPLMAIIAANQSFFAKKAQQGTVSSAFICSAIFTSLLMGGIFFFLFNFLIIRLIDILPMPSEDVRILVTQYLRYTKYSILVVPIVFAVKGLLNGYFLTKMTLKIGLVETIIRCFILILLAITVFFLKKPLSETEIIASLAFAIIFSELFGLIFGIFLIRKNKILFFDFSYVEFWREFKKYFRKTYGFFTLNAFQNFSGVSVFLLFSNILANLEPQIYAVYRIMLIILGFNKIVTDGYQQSTAIYCAKKLINRFLPAFIKDYISLTILLSYASAILCFLVFYAILGCSYPSYFIYFLILTLGCFLDPFTATLYKILLHCKFEKQISLVEVSLLLIYAALICLIGYKSIYILFALCFLNDFANFTVTIFLFRKKIQFKSV